MKRNARGRKEDPESKLERDTSWKQPSAVDRLTSYLCTPEYIPSNREWEITFRVLGFSRKDIENFWAVFCRINTSATREMTMLEFLTYFDLHKSKYINKCFEYFDTTGAHEDGGGTVDFLEFVISIWNICTLNCDTLANFTFDLYDLDADGEMALGEIESMVVEVFGDLSLSPSGSRILKDIQRFAESRGGVLNVTSFTIYTQNHATLLLPIHRIQEIIQRKILGVKYWKQVDLKRPDKKKLQHKTALTPRYVQTLLRTYKTGGVAAMLTHTGDPNKALLEWYKQNEGQPEGQGNEEVNEEQEDTKLKFAKFKNAVDKVKEINAGQKTLLKKTATNVKFAGQDAVDATASAILQAGKRSRESMSKVAGSTAKITSSAFSKMRPQKETKCDEEKVSELVEDANQDAAPIEIEPRKSLPPKVSPIKAVRHKQRRPRQKKSPTGAKSKRKPLLGDRIGKLDLKETERRSPTRQPGAIVISITAGDSFQRES